MPTTPIIVPVVPLLLWKVLATTLTYVFQTPFSPKTAGWAGGFQPPGYGFPRYPKYGDPDYIEPDLLGAFHAYQRRRAEEAARAKPKRVRRAKR